jgi:methyltransferase
MDLAEVIFWGLWAWLFVQRTAELWLNRRNVQRLLDRGGREVGARHYPLFFLLHGGWFVGWTVESLALGPVLTPGWKGLMGAFVLAQALRLWVIASLGDRWTTRIVVVPAEPPVVFGPYRWIRHPNYAAVTVELLVVPLLFGAWTTAIASSVVNLVVLLGIRIPQENRALATVVPPPSRGPAGPGRRTRAP